MATADYIKYSLGASTINVELTQEDINLAIDFAIKVFLQYGDFFKYTNLRVVTAQNDSGIIPIPNDIEPDFVYNVIYTPSGFLTYLPDWAQQLVMKSLFSNTNDTIENFGMFLTTLGNIQDLQTLLGKFMTWYKWDGNKIRINPIPLTGEKVGLLYYNITNFSILENNFLFNELALAKAKTILGAKYQKYSSLPGASSDITLYQGYYNEGETRIKEIIEELKSKAFVPPIIVD